MIQNYYFLKVGFLAGIEKITKYRKRIKLCCSIQRTLRIATLQLVTGQRSVTDNLLISKCFNRKFSPLL
jgi:hypothetical protein